jgi:hypothetical protein
MKNMTTAQKSLRRARRRDARFRGRVSADQTLTKDGRLEGEDSLASGDVFVRSGIAPAGHWGRAGADVAAQRPYLGIFIGWQ